MLEVVKGGRGGDGRQERGGRGRRDVSPECVGGTKRGRRHMRRRDGKGSLKASENLGDKQDNQQVDGRAILSREDRRTGRHRETASCRGGRDGGGQSRPCRRLSLPGRSHLGLAWEAARGSEDGWATSGRAGGREGGGRGSGASTMGWPSRAERRESSQETQATDRRFRT